MDNILSPSKENILSSLPFQSRLGRIVLGILVCSIFFGVFTGYILAKKPNARFASVLPVNPAPKSAQQDNRTFKDFAEGTLKVRPASKNPNEYVEGSHILVREGGYPVALTSSVVDLSQYEGKKIKVFGETQKALKEGWLMDVGRVEETN